MGQCLAEPVAQHLGLFGEGAQPRKVMDHAGVDLQVHGHAGGLQPLGIALSFVDQRVVLGQHHQRGGQPAQVGCLQRGKAPVLPVRIAAQVLAEHPGQGVTFQQMAGGQARMRVTVLLRCRAGVEQQLQQGLGHARVARGDAQGRGQRAPDAVAANGQALRVQAMAAAVLQQPGQGVLCVEEGGGKAVLWRQPVVDGQHIAGRAQRQAAAQAVMRFEPAQHIAAAVKEQQAGRGCVSRGCAVEPGTDTRAVARGQIQVLGGQIVARQVQRQRGVVVGGARLRCRHLAHARAAGCLGVGEFKKCLQVGVESHGVLRVCGRQGRAGRCRAWRPRCPFPVMTLGGGICSSPGR